MFKCYMIHIIFSTFCKYWNLIFLRRHNPPSFNIKAEGNDCFLGTIPSVILFEALDRPSGENEQEAWLKMFSVDWYRIVASFSPWGKFMWRILEFSTKYHRRKNPHQVVNCDHVGLPLDPSPAEAADFFVIAIRPRKSRNRRAAKIQARRFMLRLRGDVLPSGDSVAFSTRYFRWLRSEIGQR